MAELDTGALDIDRMVRGAMPQAVIDRPKIEKGLTEAAEGEAKEKGKVADWMKGQSQYDVTEVHRKYEGIEPADVKPWDAKAAKKEFSTDPIEAFGSVGFIAAQLASAFTRTPMVNALNAGGAAIQAMNEKNDKDYDRAFTAWKENTNLAIKRHDMQRQDYDSAIRLMDSDHKAGSVQMELAALKYGDQRRLALIRGGHFEELAKLDEADRRAYLQLVQMAPQIEKQRQQRQLLDLDPDWHSEDKGRKQQALRRVVEGRLDPTQQIFDQYSRENPDATAEDKGEFYKNLKTVKQLSPEQTALKTYIDEGDEAGTPRSADDLKKFMSDFRAARAGGGGMSLNASAEKQAAYEKIQKAKESGVELSWTDAIKQVREETSRLPEKEKNVLRTQIDQFDNSADKIGTALGVLETHIGAAGIAGRATRLGERVGNIFGSNSTDREQFMRDIQYLRLAAGRLLTESRGRPLAAEASRINDIVGGLDLGDTTANTLRALNEVKTLYAKMRADNLSKLKGTWQPREERGGVSPPPPSSGTGSQPWLNDPVVGGDKRSEVMSDESPDPIRPSAQYAQARMSREQVENGTEYGTKEDIDWYVKNYGHDVRKWPYKANIPANKRMAMPSEQR